MVIEWFDVVKVCVHMHRVVNPEDKEVQKLVKPPPVGTTDDSTSE